jgi:hypothetical protein
VTTPPPEAELTRRAPGAVGSQSVTAPGAPGAVGPVFGGSKLIEFEAEYLNLFDRTPLEHLSVVTPDMEPQPSWPTHRTDFGTRDAAWARALELVVGNLGLGTTYEFLYSAVIRSDNLHVRGEVHYYRGRGSSAFMDPDGAHGNIVAIVEHPVDPKQPPHFHVVRPPSASRP